VACQEAQLKLSNIYDKIDASSLEEEHQGDLDQAEEHRGTETTKPTTTVSAETQPNTASETIEIFVDAVDLDEDAEEHPHPTGESPPELTIRYTCKFCLLPQVGRDQRTDLYARKRVQQQEGG